MNEAIGAVAGVMAVAGVLLNNRLRRECFLVWMGSNLLSLALHVDAGMWALSARDAVFFVLAIDGWRRWGRVKKLATREYELSRNT